MLDDSYVNAGIKVRYKCNCGNIAYIRFSDFKRGRRCVDCGRCKEREAKKLSFGYVESYFKERGCELLEREYINNFTKMKYKCSCGRICYTTWQNFRQLTRAWCWDCYVDFLSSHFLKYSFDYIKEYFKKHDCELLDVIETRGGVSTKSIIFYKCKCGNIHQTSFYCYKNSKYKRCPECVGKKNRGYNHYLYNPNITEEERITIRHYAEYGKWRNEVFERDKYTCQICGDCRGGNLNAHHLNGYTDFPEQRTEVNNGITLCEECHTTFHKQYGFWHNIKEQFYEFKQRREQELKGNVGRKVVK